MNYISKTLTALSIVTAFICCQAKTDPEAPQPEPEPVIPVDTTLTETAATVKIGVSEPSGLTWNKDRTALFVISDGGEISEIRPATGAKKAIVFSQSGYDWEGLCMDRDNDVLYAIQEKGNKIYSFSGTGHKTCTLFHDATIPGTQDGSDNYGCEGLEYANGVLYLGNQHNPCLVQTVNASTKEVIANIDIPFATFISDLCYDETDNTMWILESNARKEGGNQIPKLYNCSLPDFTLRYTVTLPTMVQAEGLEIDRKNGKIYVCCDNTANLYTLNYGFQE